MELAGTLINVFVVVAMGAFLAYLTRDRFVALRNELKADISRVETRVDAGFAEVRTHFGRVDGRFGQLEARVDQLRSDLTSVALAVGAKTPRSSRQSGGA